MKEVVDLVQFESQAFRPFLPEDAQVNPQVYGAELAFWLSQQLALLGVVTTYPGPEDWGWYLEYFGPEDAEFRLMCSNVEGRSDLWMLALRRFARKLLGRDRPPLALARPLLDALRRVLDEAAEVEQVRWLLTSEAEESSRSAADETQGAPPTE